MSDTFEFNQTQKQTKQNGSNKEDFKQWVRLGLCDCGNDQASNPTSTKEMEIAHMGLIRFQFDKWNCQGFINIKKYKTVF